MMALDRTFAGFVTSVSETVRAQTLPTPGAPIPGAPNNSPNEERNIAIDAALLWGADNPFIDFPDPQDLFDSGQAPLKNTPYQPDLP